jgi:hypothetical protein
MAQRTYCALADVTANNPHRTYNTTSKPTATQVGLFITNTSAELDMRIQRMGIAVPITTSPATFSSLYLKKACAYEAAAMAEDAAYMGGNKQESTHGSMMHERYKETISEIEKNPTMFTNNLGRKLRSLEVDNPDEIRIVQPFCRSAEEVDGKLNW